MISMRSFELQGISAPKRKLFAIGARTVPSCCDPRWCGSCSACGSEDQSYKTAQAATPQLWRPRRSTLCGAGRSVTEFLSSSFAICRRGLTDVERGSPARRRGVPARDPSPTRRAGRPARTRVRSRLIAARISRARVYRIYMCAYSTALL